MKKLILLLLLFTASLYAADTKVSGLAELTAVAAEDWLYIIDDPAGTPVSKKITVLNLFDMINTSSKLAGILGDETGTGLSVFGTSPVLVTPALGTPSALVGTNITGTAAGLTAGNVTTNANLTGEVTSIGNATTIIQSFLEDGGASEMAITAGMMNSGTGASSSTFWRGDNTWAVPGGGGDLLADGTVPLTADWDVGAFDITAIEFKGALIGNATTATTAAAGDSATAFFSSGTIEHEWGGLELDVSGFSGMLAISGGNTLEVDSKSELAAQIADITEFADAAGEVFTGVHDFGGATSLEIPNGTDPDVTVVGQISNDTDGGNETGDVSIRAFDGTNQFLVSRKLKTLNFTLLSPSGIDAKDFIPIWHNNTGMTFTVVEWKGWSNIDNVLLDIETATGVDYTNRTTVDAVTIATNGTGVFYGSDSTITAGTIAADSTLAIDFGATAPEYVQLAITGWFNSDVD